MHQSIAVLSLLIVAVSALPCSPEPGGGCGGGSGVITFISFNYFTSLYYLFNEWIHLNNGFIIVKLKCKSFFFDYL